jgi:hypothetical protein
MGNKAPQSGVVPQKSQDTQVSQVPQITQVIQEPKEPISTKSKSQEDIRDEMREKAEEEADEAEKLIKAQAVSNVLVQVAQAAAGLTLVAASVNPITLPIVAGAALVIGVVLQLKAGHVNLLSALRVNSARFSTIIDFMKLSDEIILKIIAKHTNSPIRYLQQSDVYAAAQKFRMKLLAVSPPSVIKKMKELGSVTNANLQKSNTGFFKRDSTVGKMFGTINRIANSSAMIDSIVDSLQELINECVSFQGSFLLYLITNKEELESVLGEVKATEMYRKVYNINDEAPATNIESKGLIEMALNAGAESVPTGIDTLTKSVESVAIQAEKAVVVATETIIADIAREEGEDPQALKRNLAEAKKEDSENDKDAAAAAQSAMMATTIKIIETPVIPVSSTVESEPQAAGRRRNRRSTKKAKKIIRKKSYKRKKALDLCAL